MGKSAPTPPPPPDPNVVSAAQTKSNEATSLYQSQLNNGNSYGPTGSVTNQYDPATNQWTQNTTLSPAEQAIFDQGTSAEGHALGLANYQLGNVGNALAQGAPQVPTLATGVNGGPIQNGYDPGGAINYGFSPGSQGIQYGFNQGQGVQGQIGSTPVQMGLGQSAPIQYGFNPGGSVQGQVQGAGQVPTSFANAGQAPTSQGAGNIQNGYNLGGQVQMGLNGASMGDPAINQAIDATYGQATSRLNPQWQQNAQQQQANLVAQGLNPNDAAYQNSMQLFNNSRNDAYNQALFSAIGSGQNEQNTLFGQGLSAGQFHNAAQGQLTGELAGQAAFGNQAQNQRFGQELAGQGQQFGQNLAGGQFAQAGQEAQFGQNLAGGQFANQAQNQQFGQNAAQQAAYNQAQNQQFGQGLAGGQFANQAAGQLFGQGQAQGQFANQAAGQQYSQGLGAMQASNQAAAQQYAQNQGQAAFSNAAQNQANSQNAAQAGFANTAQGQAFGQGIAGANLWNQAAQQNFGNQGWAQQLPINEFNALMSSGQVSMPGAAQLSGTNVAPTDVLGAYALNSQAAQANYAAQQAQYQSGLGGLFNLGSSALGLLPFMSDARVKTDIAHVGTWRGHNLYSYRFLWDDEPQLGVLAQEVAQTRPDAVVDMGGGLLGVRYGML